MYVGTYRQLCGLPPLRHLATFCPTRSNVHISLPALMNVLDVCQLAYVPGPNKYDAMPGVRLTRETMPKHSIGHRIPVRYSYFCSVHCDLRGVYVPARICPCSTSLDSMVWVHEYRRQKIIYMQK